jgi:hypothetical protein
MTVHRQRNARKGKELKIRLRGSWLLGHFASSSRMALSLSLGCWCLSLAKTKTSSYWLEDLGQDILHRYMEYLHTTRSIHLHQAGLAQIWILMQVHTISPPWHPRDARSGKPSFILCLKHRAPRDWEQLLIRIPFKTTLRPDAMLAGTLPSKPAILAWWDQQRAILRIAPSSTRP